jgi:hypothetical protein
MENAEKPFGRGYVMNTTIKHARKSIDISIRKTLERIAEFEGNQEKSKEIFETLSALHAFKRVVDEFQSNNKEVFSGA